MSKSNLQKVDTVERNYGIDALRLLSMFFIVILHIMLHGGVLDNTSGAKKDIAWLIEIIVWCAVDIYGLISGYVGYSDTEKPLRSSKYISMWMQVFFYSFGITVCFKIVKPQLVNAKMLIEAFFPVATKQYWYFSAFTGLFLIKRWINGFLRKLSNSELNNFAILLICSFSIYNIFSYRLAGDPFSMYSGASFAWLVVLYILGAWIKKGTVADKVSTEKAWLIISVCTVLTWVARQFLPAVVAGGVLVSNLSPTILFSSIAYLILFSKMRLSNTLSTIVTFFAPAAFGVYLIHEQRLIRSALISNSFIWIANSDIWKMPFLIIGAGLIVFGICIGIEKTRLFLFDFLKIDFLISRMGEKIDDLILKLNEKVSGL